MTGFNRNPLIDWALKLYILLCFAFIFAPIAASFVFSFNADRFPSLPLGGFSTVWYETVAADPLVWEGLRNTLIAGVIVSVVATARPSHRRPCASCRSGVLLGHRRDRVDLGDLLELAKIFLAMAGEPACNAAIGQELGDVATRVPASTYSMSCLSASKPSILRPLFPASAEVRTISIPRASAYWRIA